MYAGMPTPEVHLDRYNLSVSLVLNLSFCLILILCLSGSDLVSGFDPVSACQGMDPVVRQVGQHIEMEPEWEAAFTLQMKLTHIISMIQEWCSTDVSPTYNTLHTTNSGSKGQCVA